MTGQQQWAPGDVAIRTFDGGKSQRAFVVRGCEGRHSSMPHWHLPGGGWDPIGIERTIPNVSFRPLAVIDPEDRQAVERLLANYHGGEGSFGSEDADDMQAALREFAAPTPPRPNEPPPWSVAVVANSTPFTRVGADHITKPYSRCWFGEHPTTGESARFTWDELHDLGEVRVVGRGLSEGIEQP